MKNDTLNGNSMRLNNQKNIINLLRIHSCSRAELARKTGLTRAAISVLMDGLRKEEVVVEDALISGKVGRSSMNMKLNPKKYCILAYDIARDGYSIGLSDFSGEILVMNKYKYEKSYHADNVIVKLIERGKELLVDYTKGGGLLGIGITAPGPLDAKNGLILNPPNFKEWENIQIVKRIQEAFECVVCLENNAKALAQSEWYYGGIKEYTSYLELVVDSGIGGGIILDGKPYMGRHGFSGDIGHISININGDKCNCGNIGCAELYASIPNIVKYACQIDNSFINWKEIIEQKEKGNKIAESVVDKEIEYLVTILTTAINLLDIEAIVIAGEILYHFENIRKLIEDKLNQRLMGRNVRKVKVFASQLTKHANILAATNLVIEQYVQMI